MQKGIPKQKANNFYQSYNTISSYYNSSYQTQHQAVAFIKLPQQHLHVIKVRWRWLKIVILSFFIHSSNIIYKKYMLCLYIYTLLSSYPPVSPFFFQFLISAENSFVWRWVQVRVLQAKSLPCFIVNTCHFE